VSDITNERDFFEEIFAAADPAERLGPRASARLKSRTYSRLMLAKRNLAPCSASTKPRHRGEACVFSNSSRALLPLGKTSCGGTSAVPATRASWLKCWTRHLFIGAIARIASSISKAATQAQNCHVKPNKFWKLARLCSAGGESCRLMALERIVSAKL